MIFSKIKTLGLPHPADALTVHAVGPVQVTPSETANCIAQREYALRMKYKKS